MMFEGSNSPSAMKIFVILLTAFATHPSWHWWVFRLVSAWTPANEPGSRASRYAGAAVQDARRAKERTCRELLQTRRGKLVALAIEVGGRWSQEATTFLRLLAQAKARTIPARLKASFTNALIHRWSAQITHAAMTAYAASLLDLTASRAPSQTATNL